MIVRARNDELVRFQVLVIDHLPRLGTFDPQILRHLLLAKEISNLGPDDAIDPVHGSTTLSKNQRLHVNYALSAAASAGCRSAEASRVTSPSTSPLVALVALPLSSRLWASAPTSAEPTTTPSAILAIALTCASLLTPKPTAIGNPVCALMRLTCALTSARSG